MKADFHGAIMTVVRSTCPPFVGTRGIVLQETENVFRFITKQNLIKTIPKAVRKGFRCALPWCMVHGACFCGVCFFVHLLGEDQDALTCPWGREIIKREEERDGTMKQVLIFCIFPSPLPGCWYSSRVIICPGQCLWISARETFCASVRQPY